MLRTRHCLGESGKMKVLVTTVTFGTRKPNYLAGWDGCGCLYVKSNGWWKILAILKNKQTKMLGVGCEPKQSETLNANRNLVIHYDLPAWGAVETSAAQHWDNDNKKRKELKTQQWTIFLNILLATRSSVNHTCWPASLHFVLFR